MDVAGWNDRYRLKERVAEDFEAAPTPLVVKTAQCLSPGRALDLACGTGRNTLWLAEQGWSVTAVDGSVAAVEELGRRVAKHGLVVETHVADLATGEYQIDPKSSNLILMCYYLQTNLFDLVKAGVVPGGVVLVIVHAAEPGAAPTEHSLRSGELLKYFRGWEILHSYEGQPEDSSHRRRVAEIVARRPLREVPANAQYDPLSR